MYTKELKEKRIAQYNIRHGVIGAKEKWDTQLNKKRRNLFAKFTKKNVTSGKVKETIFNPIYTDEDFFDIPIIYHKSYCVHPDEYNNIKDYHNPLVKYNQGIFSFSETQFKQDLIHKGYNADDVRIAIRDYNPGKVIIKVNINYHLLEWDYLYLLSDLSRKMENEKKSCFCTECLISFLNVDMAIYRFYRLDSPDNRFYVIPAMQLGECPIDMDESSFYQLDLASLLLDMADDLREREINNNKYVKIDRCRKIAANAYDISDIQFWNIDRVSKAVHDYRQKNMTYQVAVMELKRNLMKPLKKYFDSCLLSHPESIIPANAYSAVIGGWKVRIYQKGHGKYILETLNDAKSYSFNLENKQYSQFALEQYLRKVEEYGKLWEVLEDHFELSYNGFR